MFVGRRLVPGWPGAGARHANPLSMRSHQETLGLLSGAFLAIVLGAADQAIVTPALPAIARDLHGLQGLSWVVIAYLLTSTTTSLVYGKLSDAHGRGRFVIIALLIFIAGSVLCTFAHNMTQLIIARAIQGVGAGGVFVLPQAMIGDIVGPRERTQYMAYISAAFAIATISGPPLGGFLVEFDWRWCFWINLPLGALALVLIRRAMPYLPSGHGRPEIDVLGLSLLTGSVTAFLLVCSWVGRTFAWDAPPVTIAFAVAVVLLAAFLAQERRTATPVFPARIFAKTIVKVADVSAFMTQLLQLGAVVLVPVFLQLVLRIDPGGSGVLLVPLMVGTTLGSLLAGRITRQTGRFGGIMPVGLMLGAAGFALLATVGPGSALIATVAYLLLVGTGLGVNYPILGTLVQNTAGSRDLGVATSALQFCRSLGGAFGAAAFWSLLLAFVPHQLGRATPDELAAGFHGVFLVAAALSVVGAIISLGIRGERQLAVVRPEATADYPPERALSG